MPVLEGGFSTASMVLGGVTSIDSYNLLKTRLDQKAELFNNSEHLRSMYDTLENTMGSAVVDRTLHFKRMSNSAKMEDDIIRPLNTHDDMIAPPLKMIPFLMANPTLSGYAKAGVIEGYSDRYTSPYGSDVKPLDNDFYRAVMDGTYIDAGDGSDEFYHYTTDIDVELSGVEKLIVTGAWDNIINAVEEDEIDVTSKWGNSV